MQHFLGSFSVCLGRKPYFLLLAFLGGMILEMFSLIKAQFFTSNQRKDCTPYYAKNMLCTAQSWMHGRRDSRNFFPSAESTDSNHLECAELTRHHVFLFTFLWHGRVHKPVWKGAHNV